MNMEQRLFMLIVLVVVATVTAFIVRLGQLLQWAMEGVAFVTGLWASIVDWQGAEE